MSKRKNILTWIPALGSEEDLTPIIKVDIKVKNKVTIKHNLKSGSLK